MNYLIKKLLTEPYLYIIIVVGISLCINIIYSFIYLKLYNNNNNNFTILSTNKEITKLNIMDFIHYSNHTFYGHGNSNILSHTTLSRLIVTSQIIISYVFTTLIIANIYRWFII